MGGADVTDETETASDVSISGAAIDTEMAKSGFASGVRGRRATSTAASPT